MTIVPVPEAAVNEDYGPMLGKYKVRLSGQPLVMQQIAETSGMDAASDNHFWLRVLAADTGHHTASDLGRNNVSHTRAPVPVP